MTRQHVLDLYFMEARAKLIDLAAFLDRIDRAEGQADFRLAALKQAMQELQGGDPSRAEKVLLRLRDPPQNLWQPPLERALSAPGQVLALTEPILIKIGGLKPQNGHPPRRENATYRLPFLS